MLHGLVTIIGTSISDDKRSSLLSGKSFRCVCGNCQPMATSRESLCCQEVEQMVALLDGDSPPSCITQHPDFASVCLCRAVLTVSLHSYRYHYGTSDIPTDDNRL